MPPSLPITPLLPQIAELLGASRRLALIAPPGAGKTTLVPPALLSAPWLGNGKVVMLEPRRLAARAAARRMASLRNERVGETFGYRVHLDTVVGPRTRVEVVTEGVLTRMLQSDPTLDGIGAVIFDEFHERSLHADLGLALALHSQRVLRDDLRIVIMSATLDGAAVARAIDAPLIESEGRAFPVTTLYRPRRDREYLDHAVTRVVHEAISDHEGDVLVFLPGGAEIRRAASALAASPPSAVCDIRPLYGDLGADAQDAAIAPSPPGRRKIVLATNIAETSLTIEGVRVVVDAGLARTPRFSPRTGLTRLETVRTSRASSEQRRGRAGRTAPGVCYRVWSESDDAQLAPRGVPEILDADLAPMALELAVAGIGDPGALTWIDAPPAGALAQARALLVQLGALTDAHESTPHGRTLAALPAHPRLAHMILRGRDMGHGQLACALTALFANRDILQRSDARGPDADLRPRLEAIAGTRGDIDRINRDALAAVRRDIRVLHERLGISAGSLDPDMAGVVLAFAYPDRIARRRSPADTRYLMSNGTGAHFEQPQSIAAEEWLVIAETDGRTPESRIYLAAPATLDALVQHSAAALTVIDDVRWDDRAGRVNAVRRTVLGAITIKEQTMRDVPVHLVHTALLDAIRRAGIASLNWSESARTIRERLAFLRAHDAAWPDVSDVALVSDIDSWLAPLIGDARAPADIARGDLSDALLARLDWKQRAQFDALAPTHIDVPSGSRVRVDYGDPAAPSIAVRLQELYGLASTPSVLGGRVLLTLHLLSPAHRPVQVTRDLATFWQGSYADVRKEMRGRYPKHDWPDDPASATPHRGRRK